MHRPLQRLLAGLSLTAAALTGGLAGTATATTPPDTAWGAPAPDDASTDDTAWGTPPPGTDGTGGTPVAPMDTAWG